MAIRTLISTAVVLFFTSEIASAVTISAGFRGQGSHNLMPSRGAVVNYRPVPKLGLSYSFNYAESDAKDALSSSSGTLGSASAVSMTEATVTRQLHEAQLRWYPMGGSFFFGVSAMGGAYTGKYEEVSASNQKAARNFSGTTTYSALNFGNVWEFKHIMLGAEWFGLSRNMSHSRKESGDASAAGSEVSTQEKDYRSYLDLVTASDSASLLMVHLGLWL
jgi:hypothetical protein